MLQCANGVYVNDDVIGIECRTMGDFIPIPQQWYDEMEIAYDDFYDDEIEITMIIE